MLALVIGPVLFVAGYGMAVPAWTLRSLAFGLGAVNFIGLTPALGPNFTTFANIVAASLFGLAFAAALLRILRPIGVGWPVARLRDALQGELATALAGRRTVTRLGFESRMLDLVSGLLARLDLADPPQLALERGALASLRIGLNALGLRRVSRSLPAAIGGPLARTLDDLAEHHRRLARRRASTYPIARLDEALADLLDAEERPGEPEDERRDERRSEREDVLEAAVFLASIRSGLARQPEIFAVTAPPVAEATA